MALLSDGPVVISVALRMERWKAIRIYPHTMLPDSHAIMSQTLMSLII